MERIRFSEDQRGERKGDERSGRGDDKRRNREKKIK